MLGENSKKIVGIDEPTFTRIPANPIPVTWCAHIHNPLRLDPSAPTCVEVESPDILHDATWLSCLEKLKQPLLAAYIDPPPPEEVAPAAFCSQLKPLLSKLFPADRGYLFIWTARAQMATLLKEADAQLGFKYVENLCWIRKGLDNRILLSDGPARSPILAESKQTLLILKRDPRNQIKLRHQRNPDCVFDYAVQGRRPDARVYDVIETLIRPTIEDSKGEVAPSTATAITTAGPYLIHLWAGESETDRLVLQSRQNWIRVIERVNRSDNTSTTTTITTTITDCKNPSNAPFNEPFDDDDDDDQFIVTLDT